MMASGSSSSKAPKLLHRIIDYLERNKEQVRGIELQFEGMPYNTWDSWDSFYCATFSHYYVFDVHLNVCIFSV
jgi:hypothetical protein